MGLNLVYEAKTFNVEDLFKRLEEAGHNVEDILFDEADTRGPIPIFEEGIPEEVKKNVNGNLKLCIFYGNVGREAINRMLEEAKLGTSLFMYDTNNLNPFKVAIIRQCYYATSAENLEKAMIGAIKFV